jgi:hypothetical protein
MAKSANRKRGNRYLTWTLRFFIILFIAFIMMFSLDVFSEEHSFKKIFIGLVMHNIPAFILIIMTGVVWKREDIGGILFILAGIAMIIFFGYRNPLSIAQWLIFCLPILVGVLFLLNYYLFSPKE